MAKPEIRHIVEQMRRARSGMAGEVDETISALLEATDADGNPDWAQRAQGVELALSRLASLPARAETRRPSLRVCIASTQSRGRSVESAQRAARDVLPQVEEGRSSLSGGASLLDLLAAQAEIEAQIEPSEDWVDPVPGVRSPPPLMRNDVAIGGDMRKEACDEPRGPSSSCQPPDWRATTTTRGPSSRRL